MSVGYLEVLKVIAIIALIAFLIIYIILYFSVKKKKKELGEKDEKPHNIEENSDSVSSVTAAVLSFAKRYGGDQSAAKAIAEQIIDTVGEVGFKKGVLYTTERKIEFISSPENSDRIESGGKYSHMVFEAVKSDAAPVQRDNSEKKDTALLENPFGMKGTFRFIRENQ